MTMDTESSKKAVKVLGVWMSPFVNRVVMALKIKSVEFELVELNPHEKSGILAKANPVHKKIPVLIHGDKHICESLIIVQYIDQEWADSGPSILPSHPYDRATALFWAAYIDDKWLPLFKEFKEAKGEEDGGKARMVMEKISAGLVVLEKAFVECGKGKPFFGGDNVGYVDIALGCQMGWVKVMEILSGAPIVDEERMPGLVGWIRRLYSDSSVKDVLLQTEALLEFYNKFMSTKSHSSSPSPP